MRTENTIYQQLQIICDKFPKKEGIIFPAENLRLTFSDLKKQVDHTSKSLLALNLKEGDRIALWSTNSSRWLYLMLAAARLGIIIVPVNTGYNFHEITYILKQADINALFMMRMFRGVDCESTASLLFKSGGGLKNDLFPGLKQVIFMDPGKSSICKDWKEFLALGEIVSDEMAGQAAVGITRHTIYSIQYTSGTTAQPKGAMLDQFGAMNTGKAYGDMLHITEESSSLIPLPFFHCFGNILTIFSGLCTGSKMVFLDTFSPTKAMESIEKEKCDTICGVPTMFASMMHDSSFEQYDLSSLNVAGIGGSICSPTIMEKITQQFSMDHLLVGYGLSEAASLCTLSDKYDSSYHRHHTVGRAITDVEIRVADPATGHEVASGVQGELWVRGYNVMKGYYNKPEETQMALDADGWLHTGDMAVGDENGYYKIVGRYKDVIIRGGENISPSEVEEVILTVDGVKSVEVVGVPDSIYVETVAAFVVCEEGKTVAEEVIKKTVKRTLAYFKVPKYVIFIDSFPINGSGKIQKFKLREQATEILGLG